MGWDRTRAAVHYRRRGFLLSVYTPRLSAHRPKIEAGFLIRIRDPRVPYGYQPKPVTRARWRWIKVHAGWQNPRVHDPRGRSRWLEVETHLTNGVSGRITTKSYVRLKAARGAPKSS